MGNWPARHDLSCWLGHKTATQTKILLTFVQAHSDLDSFTSSLELLGKLKQNFIWSLHRLEEQRFFQAVGVTWPRWPPCPYMVKTFKNRCWNRMADVAETWYTALGTQVLPSFFKDHKLIFDLFTQRSTLVPYAFVWENAWMMVYSESIEVCDINVVNIVN